MLITTLHIKSTLVNAVEMVYALRVKLDGDL